MLLSLRSTSAGRFAFAGLAAILVVQPALAQRRIPDSGPSKTPKAAPTRVEPGSPRLPAPRADASKASATVDRDRLLAGHLLRRIGFGPTPEDVDAVLAAGFTSYVDRQLDPASVDDRALERLLPKIPKSPYRLDTYLTRWLYRMVYSRRQLQEKMTLVWHEHFATSLEKVGVARFMGLQEDLFRREGLGSFRQLLVDVTKDQATLIWLDNNYNNGRATDDEGNPVPPNENYARELMQLFSLGIPKLHMDGTPVLDADGNAVPNYTEDDVKEVARALTGWRTGRVRTATTGRFSQFSHDAGNKTILGETLVGRQGKDGAREVEDVVDIIMRQPSVAPFVSKELIQKLATETPTPGYVQRVATVFQSTGGDLKATVRAILTDAEFTSDAVVRTQYKDPIEHYVGAVRALGANADTYDFYSWTMAMRQLVYFPPSVFSFYRPGQKSALVNTALATVRDYVSDQIANDSPSGNTRWDAAAMIEANGIETPEQAVDYLTDRLLVAPIQPEARAAIVASMEGQVTEEKFRGVAWLLLVSPDFQRN